MTCHTRWFRPFVQHIVLSINSMHFLGVAEFINISFAQCFADFIISFHNICFVSCIYQNLDPRSILSENEKWKNIMSYKTEPIWRLRPDRILFISRYQIGILLAFSNNISLNSNFQHAKFIFYRQIFPWKQRFMT